MKFISCALSIILQHFIGVVNKIEDVSITWHCGARLSNHFCHGNATMPSLCVAYLHLSLSTIIKRRWNFHGNSTMTFLCIFVLHVSLSITQLTLKALPWTRQDAFVLILLSGFKVFCTTANSMNGVYVFMWSVLYLCPILTKSGFNEKILIKFANIKFDKSPSSRRRVDTCGRTDRQTERYDKANRVFCDFVSAPKSYVFVLFVFRFYEQTQNANCALPTQATASYRDLCWQYIYYDDSPVRMTLCNAVYCLHSYRFVFLNANPQIPCRAVPCRVVLIHTYRAVPLPSSDNALSFVKVRV
jgi:hypothetical protein